MSHSRSGSIGHWSIALEALCLVSLARLAILLLPFRVIAPYLGVAGAESRAEESPEGELVIRRIIWALTAAGRRTPWASTCLARALAGHVMLRRRGLSSTLTLGVAKGLSAHAWLRCGAFDVCGGAEAGSFTPVASFADEPKVPLLVSREAKNSLTRRRGERGE